MSGSESPLDDTQRQRLAALADVIISGGAGLPSASEANVHRRWIDRTLAARPDLLESILAGLEGDDDPVVAIENLRRHKRSVFDALSFAIAGTYLMNPSVCRLLGLPGNSPRPNAALVDEADFYLEDGILDPVIARGAIYRPTPRT